MSLTIFSFGYWGWGMSTPQLVKAVDAVERSRGFRPPVFVDIRIQRSVRAPGFNGRAFEELVGPKRHRWMPGLGNKHIQSRKGPPIQIAKPEEAETLLDVALEAANDNRRIIFFCSCQYPREGNWRCHRTEVGALVLKAAKHRKIELTWVEWRGGEPIRFQLETDQKSFRRLHGDGQNIPAPSVLPLSTLAGIPWGSMAEVVTGDDRMKAIVGPAIWRQKQWQFPALYKDPINSMSRAQFSREAEATRKYYGFRPHST